MSFIIGMTGTLGSGKGAAVEYLVKEHGFAHFSARDFLAQEVKRRDLPLNRDSLVLVGNELRKEHGPDIVARSLLALAKQQSNPAIIESIRTIGEVKALQDEGNFYLLSIDADQKTRYSRVYSRGTETDSISFEEFVDHETREMATTDPHKQNLSKCIEHADFQIDNSGSLSDLHKQVNEMVEKISEKSKHVRPSWDEYFMSLADAAASRATCDRGRSGCVIIKDRQVLVTGYVGSPKGLAHCDNVGHQMKTLVHEDGSKSQHCVRTVHAEQNALVQAAKRGVALEGSTLYCKMTPCRVCAMLIINAGIVRVVCQKRYHAGAESEMMFKQAGVELEILDDEVEQYENQ